MLSERLTIKSISNGNKLMFTDVQRGRISKYIRTHKGKDIEVTFKRVRASRSVRQNKYYWGVIVKTLCKELGYEEYEAKEVHNILKKKFGKKKSTKKLTTTDFIEYCQSIQRWAAKEHSINLPDPNEV